jgi:hypothetical protein
MEKKEVKKNGTHKCGLGCPCGMSTDHLAVKTFLALAFIGLALAISITIVYKVIRRVNMVGGCFSTTMMQSGGRNFMYGEKGGLMMKKEAPVREFGVISKIEGNQITIMNNAAQEQLVLSQADTVIVASSTEVGLSVLEVGQDIIVIGALDNDNVLTAKVIDIQ